MVFVDHCQQEALVETVDHQSGRRTEGRRSKPGLTAAAVVLCASTCRGCKVSMTVPWHLSNLGSRVEPKRGFTGPSATEEWVHVGEEERNEKESEAVVIDKPETWRIMPSRVVLPRRLCYTRGFHTHPYLRVMTHRKCILRIKLEVPLRVVVRLLAR